MSRTSDLTRGSQRAAPSVGPRRLLAASLAVTIAATACYNFNITDPNGPTLGGLATNPTAANVSAAVVGVFAQSRSDMTNLIWRVGSMGREGINLSGNNQPDYSEPYYGPLSTSQFGGSDWTNEYAAIRDANLVIDYAPKAPDLPPAQRALAVAAAQAEKARMFMYAIETRGNLGAPVDVDRPPNAPPGPFVTEDSVYATILATLDSSLANLASGASSTFPFPVPPGYSAVASTPAGFRQFVWALIAKALCLRATAATYDAGIGGGGVPGAAATYYAAAIKAVDSSFYVPGSANFATGVSADFSSNPGDEPNTLSDPLSGPTFFADTFNVTDAQKQSGGALDARVLTKITTIPGDSSPQKLGGIPQLPGWFKFTIYLNNGSVNTAAPIPIIRDEELVLLKAEAEIGTGDLASAVADLNSVRTGSGNLPAYSGAMTQAALITELLYNRRYSLLWEQGTRWIDARRFALLSTIEPGWNPADYSGFPAPAVPHRMPVPATECEARNLGSVCNPLNVPSN